MKLIKLPRGFSAQVDDEDFEWLNQWKWQARKGKFTHYAERHSYDNKDGSRTFHSMHREILWFIKGDKRIVDHKDKNGLNNQRENLMCATQSQNLANSNRQKNTKKSSEYIGVCLHKSKYKNKIYYKWQSSITFNYKTISLGLFKTEEEAALAYNVKAIELYGEFANVNKIK